MNKTVNRLGGSDDLLQTSIEYLRYAVSARGIAPAPKHCLSIKDWPFPNITFAPRK